MSLLDKIKTLYFKRSKPVVISTWGFQEAADAASEVLRNKGSAIDAVVAGCDRCEQARRSSVGPYGNVDENGEVTLDAMVMDGTTLRAGAVACLRRIANVTKVAKAVMDHTEHCLLVGDLATKFAVEMGFTETDTTGDEAKTRWKQWIANKCQPNFRRNVEPDSKTNCGPYVPNFTTAANQLSKQDRDEDNHDTVGVIALDIDGNVAAACSTNGLRHKIPGRVGDSPIIGSGAYADSDVGAAAATGDGDHMMKFCPSFDVVRRMSNGIHPSIAAENTLSWMIFKSNKLNQFKGAIVALNKSGQIGAACHGYEKFQFCVGTEEKTTVYEISCI